MVIHVLYLQINCPDDYRQWLVSMFSLFGTKFIKLYSGPMWRIETTSQDHQVSSSNKSPVEVSGYNTSTHLKAKYYYNAFV